MLLRNSLPTRFAGPFPGLFLCLLLAFLPVVGCATVASDQSTGSLSAESASDHHPGNQPAPALLSLVSGYSGMVRLANNRYLVVHDTKTQSDSPRLGIITVGEAAKPSYRDIAVSDWLHDEGRSNDLESVCALPERANQALIAETGTWGGRFGRLFHIQVDNESAKVLQVFLIPNLADNYYETVGDNFEGLACVAAADGKVLVILGERGGSRRNPDGSLLWATFDPELGDLNWSPKGLAGLTVSAPGTWVSDETKRDITDLFLDEEGTLWSVASEDAGDDGPFRSLIYAVARIDPSSPLPVSVIDQPSATWVLEGLKVEALSAGPEYLPLSPLSFATEDENLGGIWRPLYPSVGN